LTVMISRFGAARVTSGVWAARLRNDAARVFFALGTTGCHFRIPWNPLA
jgi:hypothetical protein